MNDDGTVRRSFHPSSFLRHAAVRVALLILVLYALVYFVTLGAVSVVSSSFASRSSLHLDREVAHFRAQITEDERELDAEAERVARNIDAAANASRRQLFLIVQPRRAAARTRGVRYIAASGDVVAWGGESLPVSGNASYEFDATNLYLIRTRATGHGKVQTYERIANQPRAHSLLDPDDDWITATMFHAGPLRQEPRTKPDLVE